METKHTKGEWNVSSNFNQGLRIVIDEDQPALTTVICSLSGSPKSEETKSNAKLIAAAPELLEALNRTKLFLEAWDKTDISLYTWVTNAINKATL